MSESTVALRYAKSLIDLAQEQNVVDTVYQDMLFFKKTAEENRGLMLALKSPVVRHDKKLAILEGVFKTRVSSTSYTIFTIITKKNREAIMFSIAEEFVKLYDEKKGIVKAIITSSMPLTAPLRNEFMSIVAEATGKTVELEERVDEKLIGGYVLRVGDRQIDASIRTRLNDLKLTLLN
ncbi:ATP synthase F1 subunit delta [Runella slithyformis]|uniref:ATP synthase subunit delta n=1 Tax=Runella slithyformis (strain ATCC 29530 / DSM 19594 / LMG 11500 / NCIMB 11436 / LSU 4) TaxID=761193 RepID=A0A7U4E3U7_RUNSL|nr:ATP synthase F1 subunit delta [Runella slithyformis]AEI46599.1 ATP synthase subunit delta [Runella slithyformis DSM 19594]